MRYIAEYELDTLKEAAKLRLADQSVVYQQNTI